MLALLMAAALAGASSSPEGIDVMSEICAPGLDREVGQTDPRVYKVRYWASVEIAMEDRKIEARDREGVRQICRIYVRGASDEAGRLMKAFQQTSQR